MSKRTPARGSTARPPKGQPAAKPAVQPTAKAVAAAKPVEQLVEQAVEAVVAPLADAPLPTPSPAPADALFDADVEPSTDTHTQGERNMADKPTETIKNAAETSQKQVKDAMNDFTQRATAATERSMKVAGEASAFGKGNIEAMVESGRIAAEGLQAISRENLEFAKTNMEQMTAAAREMASITSPTDFFRVQSDFAKKSFDAMVAQSSRTSEAMLKLAGDVARPLTNRVAVAVDNARQAA